MPWRRFLASLLTTVATVAVSAEATPIAIHGRIVDAHGEPAAKVGVRLMPAVDPYAVALDELAGRFEPEATQETATDGEGRFTLTALEAGLWRVWIDAVGTVPLEARPEVLVEDIELPTAELSPTTITAVRVQGEGRSLLAGARLTVRGTNIELGLWQPRRWRGATDVAGRARVPSAQNTGLVIDAYHPAYLPQRLEMIRRRAVTLNLERGRAQPLEVRDPRGRPAPGVVARVGPGLAAASVSDADGRLVLIGPRVAMAPAGEAARTSKSPMDRLSFDLLSRDFQVRRSQLEPSSGESSKVIRLDLSPIRSVTGRVIDDVTREPLSGALVWSSKRPETLVSTRPDGGFLLPVTTTGKLSVRVAASGYLRSTVGIAAEEDGEVAPLTVILVPSSSLLGRVVDERGDPLVGVEIDAVARPEAIRFSRRWDNFVRHHALSDASGRFRIYSLIPELPYELAAKKRGYAYRQQSLVSPARRRTVKVEVVLSPGRVGRGLVVDAQDQPVVGAEITLERQAVGDSWSLWTTSLLGGGPDLRAISDLAGRYEISDLTVGRYGLRAHATGYAAATVPGVEVPADAESVDLGMVTLSAGVDIAGKVIDAHGMPLADVEIIAASREDNFGWSVGERKPARAITGVDGSFLIADRRAGSKVDLTASATGYLSAELSGVEAPSQEPVVLTLHPVTHISGRVIDGDGGPIAGAYVGFWTEASRSRRNRVRSDEQGRFNIEDAEPGSGDLRVYAEGWQDSQPMPLEVPANGLDDLEITLRRGSAVVLGTVSSPQGSPVAEADVSVTIRVGPSRLGRTVSTSGDGSFRIDGLDPGKGTLTVAHSDYPGLSRDLEVEAGENRLELQLAIGLEISGQVVNDEGRPVVGALVQLTGRLPTRQRRQASTDEDGVFELTGLADGTYALSTSHSEYAPAIEPEDVTLAGKSVHGLILRLDAGAVITGRLLGLDFDELSALFIVAGSKNVHLGGEVDFESRYRVPRVTPGEWRVKVSSASGRQGQGVVTVAPGELEVTLDIELSLGRTLGGRVMARDRSVSGVEVMLTGTDVAVTAGGESDYLGRYEITGLVAGHYRLMAYLPGSAWRLFRQIEISGDDTLDLVFELGRVAGQVVDTVDRAPIAGASLSVEPLWDDEAGPLTSWRQPAEKSETSGRFDLGELAAGSWQLSATKEGFAPAETTLNVVAGEDLVDLELALRPTEGLWFTVSHDLGADLSHIRAAVIDRQGTAVVVGRYPIEAEGRVHLASVPAGTWELLVAAPGLATVSLPVAAPNDRPRVSLARGSGLAISVPELSNDKVMAQAELKRPDGSLFRSANWSGLKSSFSLNFGEVTIHGLSAGAWAVTVTTADERRWSASVTIPSATIESVRLE